MKYRKVTRLSRDEQAHQRRGSQGLADPLVAWMPWERRFVSAKGARLVWALGGHFPNPIVNAFRSEAEISIERSAALSRPSATRWVYERPTSPQAAKGLRILSCNLEIY